MKLDWHDASLTASTDLGEALDRFRAVVEDSPQVTTNEEPVSEFVDRAEGDRVADAIVDHSPVFAVRLEGVGVLPKRVGTL